jgi:hypothetical protein
MRYEIRQVVIEYTQVEADDEEAAMEVFNSGEIDPCKTDYAAAPTIKEITK